MSVSRINNIINKNKDIAFVIGNGINRYSNDPKSLSWEDLLKELWYKVYLQKLKRPNGISINEFYDILEIGNTKSINLQREVANLLHDWTPLAHHKNIIERIKDLNAPILTTNFEETFVKTFPHKLFKTKQKGFTDFYPWTSYHGEKELNSPTDGFGIWYINGMINYHRSIKLGLSHYMGSVERARNILHKGKHKSLYGGKSKANWNGNNTWLHIIFNKSLFIFGLGLEENETFLRWLLIERTKYFKKFPDRKKKGWYISKKNTEATSPGKKFFLEKVGFEVIEVDNYDDIYSNIWK